MIKRIAGYLKAAEQGEPDAFYAVGTMYENGEGMAKNKAEAIKWYHEAAARENEMAIERLEFLKSNP
jgi:TPR repeat protein